MTNKELFYRNTISICWIVLLQLVMVMFLIGLLYGAMANDFSEFATHPGEFGINSTIITVSFYATLALLVRFFNHVVFKWFVFGMAVFFFLFFVAHQLSHIIVDNKTLALFNLLDFLHHGVAMLCAVLSFLWARIKNN